MTIFECGNHSNRWWWPWTLAHKNHQKKLIEPQNTYHLVDPPSHMIIIKYMKWIRVFTRYKRSVLFSSEISVHPSIKKQSFGNMLLNWCWFHSYVFFSSINFYCYFLTINIDIFLYNVGLFVCSFSPSQFFLDLECLLCLGKIWMIFLFC